MTRPITESAAEFFYRHAGYSYDPATETAEQGRRRGAAELAEAEDWARRAGLEFGWEDDWSVGSHVDYYGPGSAYEDREPTTCELAYCRIPGGRVLASLGCVDDASADYRRVVEAELAEEARADVPPGLLGLAEIAREFGGSNG